MNQLPMYTAEDVARILRMTTIEVYRAAKQGIIPGRVRIGRRTRFVRSVIDGLAEPSE